MAETKAQGKSSEDTSNDEDMAIDFSDDESRHSDESADVEETVHEKEKTDVPDHEAQETKCESVYTVIETPDAFCMVFPDTETKTADNVEADSGEHDVSSSRADDTGVDGCDMEVDGQPKQLEQLEQTQDTQDTQEEEESVHSEVVNNSPCNNPLQHDEHDNEHSEQQSVQSEQSEQLQDNDGHESSTEHIHCVENTNSADNARSEDSTKRVTFALENVHVVFTNPERIQNRKDETQCKDKNTKEQKETVTRTRKSKSRNKTKKTKKQNRHEQHNKSAQDDIQSAVHDSVQSDVKKSTKSVYGVYGAYALYCRGVQKCRSVIASRALLAVVLCPLLMIQMLAAYHKGVVCSAVLGSVLSSKMPYVYAQVVCNIVVCTAWSMAVVLSGTAGINAFMVANPELRYKNKTDTSSALLVASTDILSVTTVLPFACGLVKNTVQRVYNRTDKAHAVFAVCEILYMLFVAHTGYSVTKKWNTKNMNNARAKSASEVKHIIMYRTKILLVALAECYAYRMFINTSHMVCHDKSMVQKALDIIRNHLSTLNTMHHGVMEMINKK